MESNDHESTLKTQAAWRPHVWTIRTARCRSALSRRAPTSLACLKLVGTTREQRRTNQNSFRRIHRKCCSWRQQQQNYRHQEEECHAPFVIALTGKENAEKSELLNNWHTAEEHEPQNRFNSSMCKFPLLGIFKVYHNPVDMSIYLECSSHREPSSLSDRPVLVLVEEKSTLNKRFLVHALMHSPF